MSPSELDALTPEGRAQARRMNDTVSGEVRILWTSPAGRTRETAALLGLDLEARVEHDLRSLEGEMRWDDRMAAWAAGDDPRPPGGESLADGAARAEALMARARSELEDGQRAVFVTHGDIAALLIGGLNGTPLLERPRRDMPENGSARCLPLSTGAGR